VCPTAKKQKSEQRQEKTKKTEDMLGA